MAEIKTKPTSESVEDFLNRIENEQKRKDSFIILDMMKKNSAEEPQMWGGALIGFGHVRYKSPATGREVDWFNIGFSPRKANISLHLGLDIRQHEASLKRLGKHKTGAGCLYINKLSDIDVNVLDEIILASVKK